jgi:hypothetical protein
MAQGGTILDRYPSREATLASLRGYADGGTVDQSNSPSIWDTLSGVLSAGAPVLDKILAGPQVLQQPQDIETQTQQLLKSRLPPAAPLPRSYIKDVALAHQLNPEAPLVEATSQGLGTIFALTPEGQVVQTVLNPRGALEAEAPLVGRGPGEPSGAPVAMKWAIDPRDGKPLLREINQENQFAHEDWFAQLGLPSAGKAFDQIPRGELMVGPGPQGPQLTHFDDYFSGKLSNLDFGKIMGALRNSGYLPKRYAAGGRTLGDRIHFTAQRMGVAPAAVLRLMVQGKIPQGSMLDQLRRSIFRSLGYEPARYADGGSFTAPLPSSPRAFPATERRGQALTRHLSI